MDPLSATASVVAVLQVLGVSAQGLNKLLSLRGAPQQLQQLWNETEALRALLLDLESSLNRRRNSRRFANLEASIVPVLQTVRTHVQEFQHLVHNRLTDNGTFGAHKLLKVKRLYWLRAESEIQRVKQNIRDSRETLNTRLNLLGLDDREDIRARILQVQRVTLTSRATISELEKRQHTLQHELRTFGQSAQENLEQMQAYLKQSNAYTHNRLVELRTEQHQNLVALQSDLAMSVQPLLAQMEQMTFALTQRKPAGQPFGDDSYNSLNEIGSGRNGPTVRISASMNSERCPKGCRCQCHTRSTFRTPLWLRNVLGQLLWNYNSSFSMRSCNYGPCRRSLSKHNFTYYFPSWVVSRAIVASVNLDDLMGAGAKVVVNIPLIIPEEDHIIWSLVIAGNLEQLQALLLHDRNLMYVRNQWGQSIMHVAAKIHQPTVFNFLLSIGIDEHLPDENQKTAATTVLTRRGREEYALRVDIDDLAERLDWTSLHKAAVMIQAGGSLNKDLLKSDYASINSKDVLGRTPLHWLAENGEAQAIRYLTQDPWGADVHTRDITGFTPLHCACWADSLDTVAALLDAGSNANAQDKHARTPLLQFDSEEILGLMLEKDADVHISDDEGANIMHHVSIGDQASLAKILLERYDHTLFTANHNGDSPLGLAIQNNSLDLLRVLLPFLDKFPKDKVGITNNNGQNILHLAALYASTKVMDVLAGASLQGIDISGRDKNEHTPNGCFLQCRNSHCAITRQTFEEERRAWAKLMNSARKQSEDSRKIDDVFDKREAMQHVTDFSQNKSNGLYNLVDEISSDSESDIYVDAEEGIF